MLRRESFTAVCALLAGLVVLTSCGPEKSAVQSDPGGDFLKGVGAASTVPKTKADAGLAEREDVTKAYKEIAAAYLSEDLATYSDRLDEKVALVGNVILSREPMVDKAEAAKKAKQVFDVEDLKKLSYGEVFDAKDPNAFFIVGYDQLQKAKPFPVWPFSTPWQDIKPFVKPGEWLAIARVNPKTMSKGVRLPDSIYFVLRKVDGRWKVAATE